MPLRTSRGPSTSENSEPEHRAAAHETRLDALEAIVSDHAQRFDTLQSPLWKRVWFRVQGWPGQRDLNAAAPKHRPWHRWVKP